MRFIDIENWKRKEHYNYFKKMDYPHFNICANIDITKFYKYIKENELPFFISILYASSKAANSIKEFKLRIREDKVIEHEIVNPSFTVMTDDKIFSFCKSNYIDNFNEFKVNTLKEIENVKNNIIIKDEVIGDDVVYITSIPWISFTNLTHPINIDDTASIPRIAWGKYFKDGENIKLPVSVQVHHALLDGVHIGQYFNIIEEIIDNPAKYL
ncbi:chloramphenicol acetyltransferase [Clostridium sp. CTA-5]